jgi:hypothetical protein
MRINSEHAVDAANHPASRSANNPTNKATDRSENSEHAVDAANHPASRSANNPTNKATDRSEHAVTV